MAGFIGVDVKGETELAALLGKLPLEAQDQVTEEVAKYLLNVLKTYPSYRYVSRKSAYGTTFFSDEQRRWFFAALNNGELRIPYKRTQGLSKGWQKVGYGANTIIVNETPYAKYVMGEGTQSRMSAKIGWKVIPTILQERAKRIREIADGAIKRAIRKLGL